MAPRNVPAAGVSCGRELRGVESASDRPSQSAASGEPQVRGWNGRTADYLHGDWNVVRRISDHRTGQAGLFRGQASFRPCAAESGREAGLAQGRAAGLADGQGAGLAGAGDPPADGPEAGHAKEQGPTDW